MIGTRRVIPAILVVLIGVPFVAQQPRPSSGQPVQTTIDLNGLWKYMDGSQVQIEHNTRSNSVTAKFVTPYACPSGYATIGRLFDGKLQGSKLSGNWMSCNDKLLVDACRKEATFQGDFTASAGQGEISGKFYLPYFTWTGACQGFKISTKVDPYLPLALTREQPPPKAKCEEKNTPPWFDTGAKCGGIVMVPQPLPRAERSTVGVICSINYSVCGTPMEQGRDEFFATGNITMFRGGLTQKDAEKFCASKGYGGETTPYRSVCCQRWRQAEAEWFAYRKKNGPDAPGHPCNPGFDADCDGTYNLQDPTPLGDCADYRGAPTKPPGKDLPPPKPQPLPVPTQTPSASTYRIFGPELFCMSGVDVLLEFEAKPCSALQLEPNL